MNLAWDRERVGTIIDSEPQPRPFPITFLRPDRLLFTRRRRPLALPAR
jgi:hypothetical protein